jgi:hypothetical protein
MDDNRESRDVRAIREMLLAKMGRYEKDYPVQIELKFPRILAKLAELWGTADFDAYVDLLLLSDRDGRQGFPPDVANELFHLSNVHGELGLRPKTNALGWAIAEEVELEKKAKARDDS